MNTTGRVLFVRAGGAGERGPGALESAFDVVVADGPLDAVKRLSTETVTPDCVVTPATVDDLTLEAFLTQITQSAPDAATVVVGDLPTDVDDAAALVDADAYVPPGREAVLADRIRRLLGDRLVRRVVGEHERLAHTVKSIAVDVTAATDRAGVESAVYDHLIGCEAFRHVWIASRNGNGSLEVSVPVSGRLGPEDLGDLVGGGDTTFVSKAIETGQIVPTEGHVPTRSAASTFPAATVNDGGESRTLKSAAVPFVHNGRVWGLGLVSTVRSDAFDGAERALLSDLGAVVGHALWALETPEDESRSELGRGMENLVHDLRNPLGIARSHLEIAREDDVPESLDRVESALERMVDTIDRVAEGVAGTPRAEAAPDDLASAAEAAWESIEDPTASLRVEDSVGISADHGLLVRLLANLFQNAVEHGGDGVTVRIGTVPGGFFVEDDGPGIPEKEREAVFDRGYSTSENGLGIGLSIVHDVADAHDWEVSVTDADTGGARFEISGVEQVEENETR